jgi:hypothetical protein
MPGAGRNKGRLPTAGRATAMNSFSPKNAGGADRISTSSDRRTGQSFRTKTHPGANGIRKIAQSRHDKHRFMTANRRPGSHSAGTTQGADHVSTTSDRGTGQSFSTIKADSRRQRKKACSTTSNCRPVRNHSARKTVAGRPHKHGKSKRPTAHQPGQSSSPTKNAGSRTHTAKYAEATG